MNTFAIVRACALAIIAGTILHASDGTGVVTAGNGVVVDWRIVRSGEVFETTDGTAFDTAQLFVALVGEEAARAALVIEPPPAPPVREATTHVMAYAIDPACGGRRRSFDAPQGFRVYVEPDSDDNAQSAFTARLAAFCDAERVT